MSLRLRHQAGVDEREGLAAELRSDGARLDQLVDGEAADDRHHDASDVLCRARLNAADFMVAPSLALILYRPDVMPMFEGRPALELVDRLLPEPAFAAGT